mmetsp:Transcript_14914/g.30343  ORF Transcript_14914/g.30343 Transcript_14914/m.30343 type:complete len:103 (+) Transcript_14914:36-344(+)
MGGGTRVGDNHAGLISANSTGSFVNIGLRRWNEGRIRWLTGRRTVADQPANQIPRGGSQSVDYDAVYEELLATSSKGFAEPVPLKDLIQVLIEVWEERGLLE